MKFLLLILLIVSCGKKSTQQESYQVDQATFSQDADADGVEDWDEIHAGRNPFVADIQETFPEIGEEMTLVQNDGQQVIIKPQFKRILRDLLLQKSLNPKEEISLPDISQLELRFQNRPAYWRTKLAGKHFTKILSKPGKSIKIDDGFINEPNIKLNASLTSGDISELNLKTYRFIISTPDGEQIFRVSPKLSIRDFLIQYNLLPKGQKLTEIDRDLYGWRLINLSDNLFNSPVAGKTYAIVYGSSAEFRSQEIKKTQISLVHKETSTFDYTHKLNVTVFMTHAQLAIVNEKTKRFDLTNNPDIPASCAYKSRTLIRRDKQKLHNISDASDMIDWKSGRLSKLDWFEQGENGAVFSLSIEISNDEWSPQFKSELLSNIIETGVIQSDCGRALPVKKQPIPLITGLEGYLLLEASL